MSTYILVHGAFAGAWCWEKTATLLRGRGQTVLTPDLPAHGYDYTPAANATLAACTDRVIALLDAQPGPVVLVGHSLAGVVISQVAEARPDKINALVYLAAYLLPSGRSLLDAAMTDAESVIGPGYRVREADGVADVTPEAYFEGFGTDCTAEDIARLAANYRAEPLLPSVTPITVTEANFGRVPRVYITTTKDKAVGPTLQRRMVTALPCREVLSLDTGHSPYLSRAEQLADYLAAQGQ